MIGINILVCVYVYVTHDVRCFWYIFDYIHILSLCRSQVMLITILAESRGAFALPYPSVATPLIGSHPYLIVDSK